MERTYTGRSKEEYLKTILIVKKKCGSCRNLDIVNEMGLSKASVSIAMKKLENDKLIQRDDWRINLTEQGMQIAEKLYERNRFFVNWLQEIGVSEKNAEADACKIEHIVSDMTYTKLKEYVENRAVC